MTPHWGPKEAGKRARKGAVPAPRGRGEGGEERGRCRRSLPEAWGGSERRTGGVRR